jgi:hypothetical protein
MVVSGDAFDEIHVKQILPLLHVAHSLLHAKHDPEAVSDPVL